MSHWRRNRSLALLPAALTVLAACDGAGDARRDGAGGGMMHSSAPMDTAGLRELPVPPEQAPGREIYDASCASCHGEAALGTAVGPPLVHTIYEPGHHADGAFVLAAIRGVRAHHWSFGDMPPRPEVSRAEVLEIVGYVRWLQREAGVY